VPEKIIGLEFEDRQTKVRRTFGPILKLKSSI